eukprot:gnl/TRDRNA2_/TRDRNA2_203717_c0_seq1.p1 gnl/TRDRNA2_/TRDRNA2_203717_c0~~gnl/TRDRNA2_/TRDRNA2_203717_c0_seq1.p1  ORF type:complete len:156 (+),score=23.19 gnl/TRDRNA2_/TRDRNA2_203717_c0_seq1:296-763(+)
MLIANAAHRVIASQPILAEVPVRLECEENLLREEWAEERESTSTSSSKERNSSSKELSMQSIKPTSLEVIHEKKEPVARPCRPPQVTPLKLPPQTSAAGPSSAGQRSSSSSSSSEQISARAGKRRVPKSQPGKTSASSMKPAEKGRTRPNRTLTA